MSPQQPRLHRAADSAPLSVAPRPVVLPERIRRARDAACQAIAPTWPLDRSVAVNPFWELRGLPFHEVAARLGERSGATLLPGAEHLAPLVEQGRLTDEHLARAAAELDLPAPTSADLDQLERPAPEGLALLPRWLDGRRDLTQSMSWEEEVLHQVSQFCAAVFDRGQAFWRPEVPDSLYTAWHEHTRRDRGLALLMDAPGVAAALADLPRDADALLAAADAELGLDEASLERLLHGLLLSVNGWASWCAWLAWQARLEDRQDHTLRELLAVRLAWELALLRGATDGAGARSWRASLTEGPRRLARLARHQQTARVWLRAAELAWQEPLLADLAGTAGATAPEGRPYLQAAFCIDVRSEVLRRSLELEGPQVRTIGYAGFFGLPIAHRELDGETQRPQLPALLGPELLVEERGDADGRQGRRARALAREGQRQARTSAAGAFAGVEAFGLADLIALLETGLLGDRSSDRSGPPTRPELTDDLSSGGPVSEARRLDLAEALVRGLELGPEPAPLVLLVGHGSTSANNPGAAALDCGACCGQPGTANARVAAALLNDRSVRAGLERRGLPLPGDTWFVPGRHDTTTDECTLFDTEDVPASHHPLLADVRAMLADAGARARTERSGTLGLEAAEPGRLARLFRRRGRDWSQVRPEWGLTGNAAFVIGPRVRTRDLDLGGRAFLHEYRWQDDPEFARLEGLLTAPLVVTHWINLQYYASTVDPQRYGSGNKVLHNVVGGSLGVFEGNGGDLRLGLARQSLHDGQRWRHEPLRLTACVQAPREAIAAIVDRHEVLRQLVDGQWLDLIQLDDEQPTVARLRDGHWQELSLA